ncbi:MAG: flagellar brake protein [Pseudomonadales bacterium]
MAEAFPTGVQPKTAEGERPGAIYTTYLEKAAEIAAALKTLRNQGARVQLTFENESSICSARILDVLDNEFFLEDLQPRPALKHMTAKRRFAFSGRAGGVYFYSEHNRVSRIDEDRGVPYFRVPFPASALFQQRRRAARYQLPYRTDESTAATVTVHRLITTDKDHAATLDGSLLDVSAGGCRIAVPGPVHPPLSADEVLKGALIRIPGRYELKADAVVRHASYNKLTRKVICGLEFTGMDVTDRRRLAQFIQSLARDRG